MPPKPKPAAPSKKTDQKKKEKVIEDKTFGLKNKKGAKQQKFIQQVQKQVQSGGPLAKKAKDDPKKDKDAKLTEQKEMAQLFRPVQKIEKGADPKTILCAFFKQGQCGKGSKCKFSHDLAIERKAEKRSIYVDMRDDDDLGAIDPTIDLTCPGDRNRPTTDVICKFFLDAVENSRYGWFWKCPNGESCIYKHALPPGFVLKKDMKKEKKEEISLEDLIERERAALASSQYTRITLETFLAWKKRKLKEKKELMLKDEEKKRSDYRAGKQIGLSGREMFSFNPELAAGDLMEDGDEVFNSYTRSDDEEDDEIRYREIELDLIETEGQEVDGSGTQAADDRLQQAADRLIQEKIALGQIPIEGNGEEDGDDSEESTAAAAAAVDINESLFLDDDLDEIDQELEELDIDSDS